MIDIIIPVLNEEKILKEKQEYYLSLKRKARVVFVDGGSVDLTAQIARNYGEVISSVPGRAFQKNRGAEVTHADMLLFLHVDSFISDEAISHILQASQNGLKAGCLTMKIQDQKFIFRIYEFLVNVRAKFFGVIDGDLGLIVNRDIFEGVGRFDNVPMMEDIFFSKKLCRATKIKVLSNPIFVSTRKWHKEGFLKTFFLYTLAYLQLWSGARFLKNDHP